MNKTRLAFAWALLWVSSAGCAGALPGRGNGGDFVADFEGALRPTSGYGQLSGSARAVASLGTTAVFVALRGSAPGAIHPWHVHRGRCGSSGAILGAPDQYPAINPADDGSDRVTTTIAVQLTRGEAYHVNVHLSPEQMNVIVACADLAS